MLTTRQETERLVKIARERKTLLQEALKKGVIPVILLRSHDYHDAFDDLKLHTKWSLSKLFAVVNEGQDF